MNNKLTGSDLTRAMLERGDTKIWCVVDDDSDESAMMDFENNDFTARIVSHQDSSFICSSGAPWQYAVPIKLAALTQDEAGL